MSKNSGIDEGPAQQGLSRRSLTRAVAWSVPALAVAIASPAAVASTVAVNGFQVNGACGILGLLGPGFNITAGATPIPAGTTLTVSKVAGLANVDVLGFDPNGNIVSATVAGTTTRVLTFTSAVPAGQTVYLRSLAAVSILLQATAVLTLPTGFTAGTGTKPTGTLDNLVLILCSAG